MGTFRARRGLAQTVYDRADADFATYAAGLLRTDGLGDD
jgi:hypothetical protein